MQRELAARLGVSQTPVRASLGRLEREGFVAVGSTGRAFVSRLTREDFEEIYAARLGLEGLAARLGAEAVGPAELASMRETLEQARAGRRRTGRRRLPRAPLGVLRHVLPRERPAPARRARSSGSTGARSATTASCSRRRSGSSESLGRYAAFFAALRGERRASPPSAPSRTASAGRSTASRAACPRSGVRRERRRRRSSAELLVGGARSQDARVSAGDSERRPARR